MLDLMSKLETPVASPVCSLGQITSARKVVGSIYIDDKVRDYIVHVVHASRNPRAYGLTELAPLIDYGASPRATLFLAVAARAHAFLRHRAYVTPDDVKAMGLDVLRHRVILTYRADAENIGPDALLQRIFEAVPVP